MKKLKMWLEDFKPLSFIHNGKEYEITVVQPWSIAIFLEWDLPAERLIQIRKKTNDKNSLKGIGQNITDYYIMHMPGKQSSEYFQLGNDEYLRFKRIYKNEKTMQVTFFTTKVNEANGYAFFVESIGTGNEQTSQYGIKAINDKKYECTIPAYDLLKFENDHFSFNFSSKHGVRSDDYFKKTMACFIELNTGSQSAISMNNRILPRRIMACKIYDYGANSGERTFFKDQDVCELYKNPRYIEEMLCEFNKKYYSLSINSHKLGESKHARIDSYIFEKTDNPEKIHQIRYQDGPQFMHFTDYRYHLRFETKSESDYAKITFFVKSEEIYNIEIHYKENTEYKLESIPDDIKELVFKKIKELEENN